MKRKHSTDRRPFKKPKFGKDETKAGNNKSSSKHKFNKKTTVKSGKLDFKTSKFSKKHLKGRVLGKKASKRPR